MAHNVPQRLSPVPDAKVTESGFVDNAEKIDLLLRVLGAMRKSYCAVIEEMRSDPSQYVLGVIDDMEETLSVMRRDFNVEGSTHLIRLISRSREDRVEDLYIPWKDRTPYRGSQPSMMEKGERHWK
eukprot:9914740-Karenia_brevis.AAC.1